VVDAQSRRAPRRTSSSGKRWTSSNTGRVFHAQRRQLVHVEKPPVVDLLGRNSPVREPVRLRVEQVVEPIEGSRLMRCAVQRDDAGVDERGDGGAGPVSAASRRLITSFSRARDRDVIRIAARARRKVIGGRQHAQ
jgi:hypothetical protein